MKSPRELIGRIVTFVALFCGTLVLASCATSVPASGGGWPAYLRGDLVPEWITLNIRWPANDGCVEPPKHERLVPGTLIDRFGSENGTFFSPKGEKFGARSVPYVCRKMEYRIYRVIRPLDVETCTIAPWFGEIGGGLQNKTEKPARALVADGTLGLVTYVAPNQSVPPPQCE